MDDLPYRVFECPPDGRRSSRRHPTPQAISEPVPLVPQGAVPPPATWQTVATVWLPAATLNESPQAMFS
jgi:hypothetical protein